MSQPARVSCFFASAICIASLFGIFESSYAETNSLKFVTEVNPTEKPRLFDLLKRINAEVCKRLTLQCSLTYYPPKRAQMMVENGEADGENYRPFEYMSDSHSQNHIRVEETIYPANVIVWGKPTARKLTSWDDLNAQNKAVLSIYGSTTVTEKLQSTQKDKLQYTNTINSGVNMLLYDRVSYFVGEDGFCVSNVIDRLGLKEKIVNLGYLGSADTYIYLNKRHKDLALKMASVIAAMKKDGTLAKILDEAGVFMPSKPNKN